MEFRILTHFLYLFFITPSLVAQNIEWQRALGGSERDVAASVSQTNDGGFIFAGRSESNLGDVSGNHGEKDYWVVKLNGSGEITWTNSLGGTEDDIARSIQQTSDNGYIVAGYSTSDDGDVRKNQGRKDGWVVKLNESGDTSWTRCLGGSGDDHFRSVQQTTGGGYVLAGASASSNGDLSKNHESGSYWVVKLNGSGETAWSRTYQGSEANSIQQTGDGGYIVAGSSGNMPGNYGENDCWVVKLDSSGNKLWSQNYGGSEIDLAYSIQQTDDDGYIMAGYSSSNNGDVSGNHGNGDCWIVKLSKSGDTLWTRSLGGSGSDRCHSIRQTSDGEYIMAGISNSEDGDVPKNHGNRNQADALIGKLNSSGEISWVRSLGSSLHDALGSIRQTEDGGYIMAGYSKSSSDEPSSPSRNQGYTDCWIIKLSNSSKEKED